MIVEILETNGVAAFPKKGEFYKAKSYAYDSDKVTLLYHVDPISHLKSQIQYSEDEPLCNEYRYNVRLIKSLQNDK